MSNDHNTDRVRAFLRSSQTQDRVRQLIERVQQKATLSIGGVRQLFGFSPNQLRSWEPRLLKPNRSQTGDQRRYSSVDLEKLAIISVLMKSRFQPGDIPDNIYEIWKEMTTDTLQTGQEIERVPLDERVRTCHQELFWRVFIPHILRLLLTLICEENSISTLGLVLPLQQQEDAVAVNRSHELHKLGESLVGWLKEKSLLYTSIEQHLSFRYPTDFQIYQLQITDDIPGKNVVFILPRETEQFHPSPRAVEIMRPFLLLLYTHQQEWKSIFSQGIRDSIDLIRDFSRHDRTPDSTLNSLMETIVELGGQMPDGKPRWRFSCVTIPRDTTFPTLQRSIIVQAQSKDGPHVVGETVVSPDIETLTRSVSLQALQSGSVIYRHAIGYDDPVAWKRQAEGNVGSSIALPVGAETGPAIAVVYVASDYKDAFSLLDQCVLRIIGRVVEELIRGYSTRQQAHTKLLDLMNRPLAVDPSLRGLLSSNDFIRDIEALLLNVKEHVITETEEVGSQKEVSFVAVNIDNLGDFAAKYGDTIIENLNKAIYDRINRYIRLFANNPTSYKSYYAYGSKFYLMFQDTPLKRLEEYMRPLHEALRGNYNVGTQHNSLDQHSQVSLTNVAITMASASFSYSFLHEVLHSYPSHIDPTVEVRAMINHGLDNALKQGTELGGNKIMFWSYESKEVKTWDFV